MGPVMSLVGDPEGYCIELVEWPAGHTDALPARERVGTLPRADGF